MRGLPPPPDDFLHLQVAWEIKNACIVTTGWYFHGAGLGESDGLELEAIAGQFYFLALPDLLSILGNDVTPAVFQLRTYGSTPFTLRYAPAPAVGAVGGTVAANSALVLTWQSAGAGRGQDGHTFLPLSTDLIDANRMVLDSLAWSQCQSAARSFVEHVNAIPSPGGGNLTFAIVHRSRYGAAYPHAQWEPVELGDASPLVGTLRRRIRSRSPFSTPF